MNRLTNLTIFFALALCLGACGCSKEADLPAAASKEKILAGQVERAKPLLDMLEKMKPEERQAAASKPRMSMTLKPASEDPATKKRIDDLGIHID